MQYIIIDTSSMLFGFANNRSVFEAVKRRFPDRKQLVSKGIISELNRLSINKGKKGACARLALLEIRLKRIQVDRISVYADSWVFAKAKRLNATTITNDTALAKRLAGANLKVFKISRNGMLKQL
ncbi:MAG: hypothetical protein KGH60_02050 [Candidatus Micrarchaeota archaeon]|nr:hypothetical protein [Candidatus Micrarchaeota archaeon]